MVEVFLMELKVFMMELEVFFMELDFNAGSTADTYIQFGRIDGHLVCACADIISRKFCKHWTIGDVAKFTLPCVLSSNCISTNPKHIKYNFFLCKVDQWRNGTKNTREITLLEPDKPPLKIKRRFEKNVVLFVPLLDNWAFNLLNLKSILKTNHLPFRIYI